MLVLNVHFAPTCSTDPTAGLPSQKRGMYHFRTNQYAIDAAFILKETR